MKFFKEKKPAKDYNSLVNLILAACEDPQMKKQIMGILKLDSFNRTSLVNTMLSHLTLQGAPAQLIEAIACLKNEEVAQKAKELISTDLPSSKDIS